MEVSFKRNISEIKTKNDCLNTENSCKQIHIKLPIVNSQNSFWKTETSKLIEYFCCLYSQIALWKCFYSVWVENQILGCWKKLGVYNLKARNKHLYSSNGTVELRLRMFALVFMEKMVLFWDLLSYRFTE